MEPAEEEASGRWFGGWLSEEVAVCVFRWLAPADLARAERVCRQWRAFLRLSESSSTLTAWLWRKAHKQHFGGPIPTQATSKPSRFNQRTFCLQSARRLQEHQKEPKRVEATLMWAIDSGHHVVLADMLANDTAAVPALHAISGHALKHAIMGNHERVVELVCSYGGSAVTAFMLWTACRRGSSVEVLLRYLPRSPPVTTAPGPPPGPLLADLEALLSKTAAATPQTMWRVAVKHGHVQIASQLLKLHRESDEAKYQALLLSHNFEGQTALHTACFHNAVGIFDLLVAHMTPALLDAPLADSRGEWTALLVAVRQGNLDLTKRLLALGARESGVADRSPLHVACTAVKNREDLVSLFLERGADVNELTRSRSGRACLHLVCLSTLTEVDMVRRLLDSGANPHLLSREGRSALDHLLTKPPKRRGEVEKKIAIAQILMSRTQGVSPARTSESSSCWMSLLNRVLRWRYHSGLRADQRATDAVEEATLTMVGWVLGMTSWPTIVDSATEEERQRCLRLLSLPRLAPVVVSQLKSGK